MPADGRFAPWFLWMRLLRGSLFLGGLDYLFFTTLLLVAPELAVGRLNLPLPGPAFDFSILAALLGIAAGCSLLAAWDPRRYAGVVGVVIAGRLFTALALAIAARRGPGLGGLWTLVAADGLFGLVPLVSYWPLRR